MDNNQLIDAVMAKPPIAGLMQKVANGGLGWSESTLKGKLSGYIPNVVQEVALAHGWDFALDSATTTTVADQAGYDLSGDSDNAEKIYNIRVGTNLLIRKTPAAMDEISSRRTISTVTYWIPAGRTGTVPRVELVDTPSSTGDTITYRYWRSNVALSEFSSVFAHLLAVALTKRLIGSFEGLYDKTLAEAIRAYTGSQTTADTGGLDPEILRRNQERAARHNGF